MKTPPARRILRVKTPWWTEEFEYPDNAELQLGAARLRAVFAEIDPTVWIDCTVVDEDPMLLLLLDSYARGHIHEGQLCELIQHTQAFQEPTNG